MNRSRWAVRSLPIAAVAAVVSAMAGTTATAATDTSPPVWSKVPSASVALGAQLDKSGLGCADAEYELPIFLDYQANDPQSGIDHYEVSGEHTGFDTTATRISWTAFTGDHSCGGGSYWIGVNAVNGAGLYDTTGPGYKAGSLVVVQDLPSTDVSYSGSWATSACNCWSGGTTQKSSQSGAAVEFVVPTPLVSNAGFRLDNAPYALGLVMAKGLDRGKAAVFVDGIKVATVNTTSATKVNRTVVWRQTMSAGSHTVRIVNLATAGHPRIDVDGFVLVRK